MDEAIRWMLTRMSRFGRPSLPASSTRVADVDRRLDALEHEQREIEARLRLLELQADPRGWRHDRDD